MKKIIFFFIIPTNFLLFIGCVAPEKNSEIFPLSLHHEFIRSSAPEKKSDEELVREIHASLDEIDKALNNLEKILDETLKELK